MLRSAAGLLLLAGLLGLAAPTRADDVKAAIEAGNAKMEADYAAGDTKAIAEAYTEDGVMLPPDATVVSGRAAKGWGTALAPGNHVVIWKRGYDGVWRINVDTWNDAPAPTTD